ncbi:hypothetical protein ACWD5A_39745, partial [Streptomyces sp. NPDC002491]
RRHMPRRLPPLRLRRRHARPSAQLRHHGVRPRRGRRSPPPTLRNMATMTGLYPLAVLSDCVVYPSPGDSPLAFLPYAASGKPQPGGFRLGPTPGLAKLEGVQTMLWAVGLMEQGYNLARHIKGGDAVLE